MLSVKLLLELGPERLVHALQTQFPVSDAVQSFRKLCRWCGCVFRLRWLLPAVASPAALGAPSQAGQGEAIAKPCYSAMLSIARSDYDVIYLPRDEPWLGLLLSAPQPGVALGKLLVSCKHRNVLGTRTPEVWHLCDVFTCLGLVQKSSFGCSVIPGDYFERMLVL